MKSALVALVAACLAGSGLAAPTQAVSSQLSRNDIAALLKLAGYKGDVPLTAREANDMVGGLTDDVGSPGHLADDVGPVSGVLGGALPAGGVLPGVKRDTAAAESETSTMPQRGQLDIVSGLLGGATGGLLGGLGGGHGGVLGGSIIPGIVKREASMTESEASKMLQQQQLEIVAKLVAGLGKRDTTAAGRGFLDNLLCSIFGGGGCPNSLLGGTRGHSRDSPLQGVGAGVGGLVDTVTDVVGEGGKGVPGGLNGLLGNFADGLAIGRKMGPVGDVAGLPKKVSEIHRGSNSTSEQPAA